MRPFLFMADAHVKIRTWTNNLQLSGDAYSALSLISESLTKAKPNVLVIGGDWFDSNRPASSDLMQTAFFCAQFSTVFHISGNHDSVCPSYLDVLGTAAETSSTASTNFIHLTETPIGIPDAPGCFIAGVDWMSSADQLKAVIKNICEAWKEGHAGSNDVLYLVLHTSFSHLLAFEGAYKLTPEFIDSVTHGLRICILVGDIHTRNTLQIDDFGYIHSPGSMYPLSFDQVDNEFAVSLIDPATGNITALPCGVRSYATIQYESKQALRDEILAISRDAKNDRLVPFVRVVVPDDMDVHILPSEYPEAVLQIVRASAGTVAPSLVSDTAGGGCTIRQAAVEEAGDDMLLQQLVDALLVADDPLAEIKTWLDLWQVKLNV